MGAISGVYEYHAHCTLKPRDEDFEKDDVKTHCCHNFYFFVPYPTTDAFKVSFKKSCTSALIIICLNFIYFQVVLVFNMHEIFSMDVGRIIYILR